jgi:hypothetical protein
MTQDEIIEMACQAFGGLIKQEKRQNFIVFAKLVAAKERLEQPEQEQQIETLKRCLFQMQEAAKDLVEQAKSLTPPQRTEPVIDKSAAIRIATALGWTPPKENT